MNRFIEALRHWLPTFGLKIMRRETGTERVFGGVKSGEFVPVPRKSGISCGCWWISVSIRGKGFSFGVRRRQLEQIDT